MSSFQPGLSKTPVWHYFRWSKNHLTMQTGSFNLSGSWRHSSKSFKQRSRTGPKAPEPKVLRAHVTFTCHSLGVSVLFSMCFNRKTPCYRTHTCSNQSGSQPWTPVLKNIAPLRQCGVQGRQSPASPETICETFDSVFWNLYDYLFSLRKSIISTGRSSFLLPSKTSVLSRRMCKKNKTKTN